MRTWQGLMPYDLREIERVIAYCVEDEILKFIDCAQQIVAEGRHGVDCRLLAPCCRVGEVGACDGFVDSSKPSN
jgi:hypothetical protein